MKVYRSFTVLAACLLLFVLVGCPKNEKGKGPTRSEYKEKREQALQRVKSGALAKRPKAANEKAPVAATEIAAQGAGTVDADFAYKAAQKRDPFRSFILTAKATSRQAGTPLETFDLFQLELVAVIWGENGQQRRALVLDPSGRPYVVEEGTAIGKNLGKVISIDDNVIWVEETYIDPLGNRTLKTIEMRLYPKQEG